MKLRSLIVISILISQMSDILSQNTQQTGFLKENKTEYILVNLKSSLVIKKDKWITSLLNSDGKICYSEGASPAFMINDKWVSVTRPKKVISSGQNNVSLQLSLSNGENASVDIKGLGDNGFNLVFKYDKIKISAIRGITRLNPVEEVYGFGEMWNGHVAQRGQSFDIWDKPGTPDECSYMPYYVSTNNYTFFLNYGGRVSFDVGQSNSTELVYQAPCSSLDITIVAGKSIANAVQNFLGLTGLPSCPPRWAFKPWFWLMHDPDKPGASINTLRGEHFIVMIDKLQKMDIPVGVTWLEPPWQDGRTSFIPNPEFCPDLKGLIKRIDEKGVKTLAWTVPYTTNTASNWKEAVEKGYLVKKPAGKKTDENFVVTSSGELEGNFYTAIDFFNPAAAKWWQEQVEKSLDLGLKGYKLDAGQDLQEDAILYGGRTGKDVHNSYALEYNKVLYKAFKNKLGDDFLMIPRATWIGSSSFTNFKWPGDLSGSFANNGLPSTVYSSISLSFCGIPFVSTDIGGFSDKPAPENAWVRWAQFGAFLPGMQTLHMPWWYSKDAAEHYRYLAWLHTDLIPLWMSLGKIAKTTGIPIIRHLVWNFQEDVKCWRVDDEFMVGDGILVAPIINPESNRDVYLPEGSWFDFWDNQVYRGPAKFNWSKRGTGSRYKFPVFIREGAIIPMDITNNVTGFGFPESKGYLTLAIWPKKNGSSEFILNDAESSTIIRSEWKMENQVSVSILNCQRDYILNIHINSTDKPSQVTDITGKNLQVFENIKSFREENSDGWYFDSSAKKLWIKMKSKTQPGELHINLNKE